TDALVKRTDTISTHLQTLRSFSNKNLREREETMADLMSLKSLVFEKEDRKQQYQAHIRGLNAYDRHKKFLKDYDGSLTVERGGIGGLFRDSLGHFLAGYGGAVAPVSVVLHEMQSIHEELLKGVENRFPRIIVATDSKLMVSYFRDGVEPPWECYLTAQAIKKIISTLDYFNIYHVFRKANKYVYYGSGKDGNYVLPSRTDQDTLREGYRYCIADMSFYKKGKIGLRWRTEKEVISGKGQFICGSKQCNEQDGLASYEASSCCNYLKLTTYSIHSLGVNFSYFEAGENKQALVKLVACNRCAEKLVYWKRKQERSDKREIESHKRKRRRTQSESDTDEHVMSNERRKGKKATTSEDDRKTDNDEHFDEFMEGMFL
ncbi:hypothetical protein GIB67_040098, partial [Kingdonia uniflora]